MDRERYLITKTERKIMTQYEKDIIWAASQFLYEDLPEDYEKWSDEKFFKFLEDNAWQPFDNYSGQWLWCHIQDLAEQVRKYAQEN